MKHDIARPLGFRLSQLALAAAFMAGAQGAWALGLGALRVQSALGETLRAEIDFSSLTPEEAASLRVRVAGPDAYRANGLDYNAVLVGTQVQLVKRADGRSVLRLVSERAVQEPFVDLILDVSWSSGRLTREFTLLFDPPTRTPAAAPAPAQVSAPPAAPAPQAPQVAAPVEPARAPAPRPPVSAPVAATPSAAPTDGVVVVRGGDSLSRIASQHAVPGASLDQMLVALYRGNPEAFLNQNMNLLRKGARLRLPGSQATALAAAEARQVVRAHAADFDQARQALAGAAPRLPEAPARSAQGQVQAQVQETRPAATSGDRLTLSRPSPAPAPAPAASAKPADVAALQRNVEDLKKLSEAAQTASAVPPAAAASAPAIAPASAVAAVAGSAPAVALPASVPAVAPAPAKPTSTPAESGWMDFLTKPLGLLGVALVALLGFAGLRLLRRPSEPQGRETVFGESKLQPDSFFNITGGQRVDTRDGASGVSSMSYSLSQLDAHGDVDPVAEADVYLAYGRDLQAEEILKEALRAQPERTAIRVKLLEVYAKRRDVRGFEQLAIQLFGETQGKGEDWTKAQEMGRAIDADNPLYSPGGQPRSMFDDERPRTDALNASTLPVAATAIAGAATETFSQPMQAQPVSDSGPDSGMLDLDLDLGDSIPPQITAPADPPALPKMDLDFSPTEGQAGSGEDTRSMDFKLDDLDFNASTASPSASLDTPLDNASERASRSGPDTLIDAVQDLANDDGDPLTRQLELAEEFRQIGDVEGARDVLQELMSQVGSGPLYEKAKAMLDKLR